MVVDGGPSRRVTCDPKWDQLDLSSFSIIQVYERLVLRSLTAAGAPTTVPTASVGTNIGRCVRSLRA
jgi:hypothetical protein